MTADNSQAGKIPSINTTADKVRYVDIATANTKGVSHNRYTEITVGKEGLIFNNNVSGSAVNVQLSNQQLGVNGNLGGKAAAVILNEVTSAQVSNLSGKMEVGGARADLIVANPNGIVCNGCGFINVGNAALVAGRVRLNADGSLGTVEGTNTVRVDAVGLTASSVSNALWLYGKMIGVDGRVDSSGDLNLIANDVNPIPLFEADLAKLSSDQSAYGYGTRLRIGEAGSMYGNNIKVYSLRNGYDLQVLGTLNAKSSSSIKAAHGSASVPAGGSPLFNSVFSVILPNLGELVSGAMSSIPNVINNFTPGTVKTGDPLFGNVFTRIFPNIEQLAKSVIGQLPGMSSSIYPSSSGGSSTVANNFFSELLPNLNLLLGGNPTKELKKP